jgi:hypothetical protein
MKLKGHDTLLRTGLLAASGGFAGVEEHAPESSLLVTGGKAGGHRTLSGVIICCKRWSRSCRGKCSTALDFPRLPPPAPSPPLYPQYLTQF